jgi:hypothetical protein
MKAVVPTLDDVSAGQPELGAADRPSRRVPAPVAEPTPQAGVVIGNLVGLLEEGATPLVIFPGRADAAAVRGRTTVDLHGADIGQEVVLLFEGNDRSRPIVMGVVRGTGSPLDAPAGHVEVDADRRRMVVVAAERLVLRCGKASITLTKAGKVLIEGAYISSRATGVNRVKGGSVQLN